MADVFLTKDSNAADFHCSCCGVGELDSTFLQQLFSFLAASSIGSFQVNSGYRCQKHNAAVGGEPNSKHLVGRAVDLAAKTVQLKTVIFDAARKTGLCGVGMGANFIHLDNREVPAVWYYPRK